MNKKIEQIRKAIAMYMKYEGCGCCGNYELQLKQRKILGKLLEVPEYEDGSDYESDYDFGIFEDEE